jgi:hypothetical protein
VDTGSREENASNKNREPRSDSIGTEKALFPMDELAMDFPSGRVNNGYLKVLIVAQAVVAEMLRKPSAVRDGLKIAFEVDPDPISKRDAIFHIEKELLHCRTSNRFSHGRS